MTVLPVVRLRIDILEQFKTEPTPRRVDYTRTCSAIGKCAALLQPVNVAACKILDQSVTLTEFETLPSMELPNYLSRKAAFAGSCGSESDNLQQAMLAKLIKRTAYARAMFALGQ
jgi:hypothetical protein